MMEQGSWKGIDISASVSKENECHAVSEEVPKIEGKRAAPKTTSREPSPEEDDFDYSTFGSDMYFDDEDSDGNNASASGSMTDPIWDKEEDTFRCTACCWEVVEGRCQMCGQRFLWDLDEVNKLQPSMSTHSDALHSDRVCIPRGTTPLLDIGPSQPPAIYQGRAKEYEMLLRRGATRLMCETFLLKFSPEAGIIAWADETLHEEFSGPAMKKDDSWKIHLGRRIQLDEDDLDGSIFIEGILEDAMIFPVLRPEGRWETVKDSAGIWVTRPVRRVVFEGCFDNDICAGLSDKAKHGMYPDSDHVVTLVGKIIGPAVFSNSYAPSDAAPEVDDPGSSDIEMIDRYNPNWRVSISDTVRERGPGNATEDVNATDTDISSGSEADSDLDMDELLSGDEDVINRVDLL